MQGPPRGPAGFARGRDGGDARHPEGHGLRRRDGIITPADRAGGDAAERRDTGNDRLREAAASRGARTIGEGPRVRPRRLRPVPLTSISPRLICAGQCL